MSPRFPDDYPSNVDTTDVITVNYDQFFLITFTHFSIEEGGHNCPYDYLTITDGNGDVLLGRTCGHNLPSEINSAYIEVHITFHTDGVYVESGWKFNWKRVDSGPECPSTSARPSSLGQPCSSPGLQCPYGEVQCCCGVCEPPNLTCTNATGGVSQWEARDHCAVPRSS